MNITKIEENVSKLMSKHSKDSFIYDLLIAYGHPKAAITRLKQGTYNLSKKDGEILWKKKLFFKEVLKGDLHLEIDSAKNNKDLLKQEPRFIIVTDYKTILSLDTKTLSTLDIEYNKLGKHFDFFLPWAGLEKVSTIIENPADTKAAEKMAKLYDQIRDDNPNLNSEDVHSLNVFLSRLLFCYFAEDTGIFEKSSFTKAIASHTTSDGSDLNKYLDRFFEVLNTKSRKEYPSFLQNFPYVNGGLLAKAHKSPKFSTKSRKLLLECGELDWSEINPDIFGSMFQAVVHPSRRGGLGMHYTSVPNILRVINPLFLDDLYSEFDKAKGNSNKLDKLLKRIYHIKIFDPACGSGNFLIIAYKELRKLEILVFKEKAKVQTQQAFQYSLIQLGQFYGIELDDFAHEIAILSLWLAEHQMNLAFKDEFGDVQPTLPLKSGGNVICANANLVNWEKICSFDKKSECYILGNPPYLGSYLQNADQKKELQKICEGFKSYKDLDYISCWFLNASRFIEGRENAQFAFVSTNSICQGELVPLLWPHIFKNNQEIAFAHQAFKWENNAKSNAAVICIILGIRNINSKPKYLINSQGSRTVSNINPYLSIGKSIVVEKRMKPLSTVPPMIYGNKIVDDGNLILSTEEKNALIKDYPDANKFIKRFTGSVEFIRGLERWCLWIKDDSIKEATKIPPIKLRLEKVSKFRLKSTEKSTRAMAEFPHKFYFSAHEDGNSIIVPRHSSERRAYIPIGFLNSDTIISDAAQAVYSADPYVFGFVTSRMHMTWVRAVGGRLKTDYRYSSGCIYNTFPIPTLSEKQKQTITNHVFNILAEREKHSHETLANLYDPEKMPEELKIAHENLDTFIEKCYRATPFLNEEQRLEYLFKLYEEMSLKSEKGKK